MFTKIDWAGSGKKLCDAIRQHTDHDIEIYSEPGVNALRIPRGGHNLLTANKGDLQHRIDKSDIIHLKSGWPSSFYENRYHIKISHKPIAQTLSSSLERKQDPVTGTGKAKYNPEKDYKNVAIRSSFEPDLLYPGYDGVLTPYPIDCLGKPIEWVLSDPPVLIHHPSSERVKRTAFIKEVFDRLTDVDVRVTMGRSRIPQAESIRRRLEATIFFDQFAVGAYGNAACEAMQYGIPVSAWISPQAFSYVPDWYREECPVITTDRIDVGEWVGLIRDALDGDMDVLSLKTKEWCDKMHSYQAVAKQWDNLYHSV